MALDGGELRTRGDTSRLGAKTKDVKGGNFRNVKGRGGILIFIGSKLNHLKRHNQPKCDTWHTPKKNESMRPVTNRVVTRGTSNR